jgi:CRP-like cAMP-binding protein
MTALTENINQIISLTIDEKSTIEKAYGTLEISKGNLWVKQGKICDQIAFVVSGKLRTYYIDEADNEITCYFVTPDHFISSFTSFLTNTPANENISALENTILRIISKKELEDLCVLVPKLHIFRRVIAENLFISMEKRIVMLQSQSAYERYEKILKENPDIIQSVPLQYTASFLGITPQHLSRLRREFKK